MGILHSHAQTRRLTSSQTNYCTNSYLFSFKFNSTLPAYGGPKFNLRMGALDIPWTTRTSDLPGRHLLFLGLVLGLSLGLSSSSVLSRYGSRKKNNKSQDLADLPPRPIEVRTDEIVSGISGLIGSNLHCCAPCDYYSRRDRKYAPRSNKLPQ